MKKLSEIFEEERMEESMHIGMQMAFGIGLLNACTYICRGKVFASSQGGNILYLGLDLAEGDFSNFAKYTFPVLMFGLGVFLGEHIHDKYAGHGWHRRSILLECVLILIGTIMPLSWNMLANPIFGLVCGIQGIAFRKFHNTSLATIYINGNIQSAIQYMTRYLHIKDEEDFTRSILYIMVVVIYLLGIVAGALLSKVMGRWASLLTIVTFLLAFWLIQRDTRGRQKRRAETAKQ